MAQTPQGGVQEAAEWVARRDEAPGVAGDGEADEGGGEPRQGNREPEGAPVTAGWLPLGWPDEASPGASGPALTMG